MLVSVTTVGCVKGGIPHPQKAISRLAGNVVATSPTRMARQIGILNDAAMPVGPLGASAGQPALYAIVSTFVAASADPHGHTLGAHLKVERFEHTCPGRLIRLSWSWQFKAWTSPAGDPPVLVNRELLCFPVSLDQPPRDLLGVDFQLRPANLYVMSGEEFLSPEPTAYEGGGANLYLPSTRGGYQIGLFAMAGNLETAGGTGAGFPTVAIGVNALWLRGPLEKMHYLLNAETPAHTQFNVGLAVKRGPAIPGEVAAPQYQDDTETFYGEETADSDSN